MYYTDQIREAVQLPIIPRGKKKKIIAWNIKNTILSKDWPRSPQEFASSMGYPLIHIHCNRLKMPNTHYSTLSITYNAD